MRRLLGQRKLVYALSVFHHPVILCRLPPQKIYDRIFMLNDALITSVHLPKEVVTLNENLQSRDLSNSHLIS